MNGANYSSSPSGFLILSKLQNGVLNFVIGFARDKYPEQKFSCTIADKDLGFSLRVNANKRWELFNLQEMTTVSEGERATISEISNQLPAVATNAVTTILKTSSKVLDDGLSEVYVDNKDTITVFIAKENQPIKLSQPVKNCTIATNEDFLKTRLQMAASNTEADMIAETALAFKTKCFSVEQIKNLSTLILTEENRLSFLLLAKKNVYDAQNFASLQSQLSKPSVIQQFRNAL